MAIDNLGITFSPLNDSDPANRTFASRPTPQEAIRVLSLRIPRFVGASPIAPAPLLQGGGSARLGASGLQLEQILEMIFGQRGQRTDGVPSFAPTAGPARPTFDTPFTARPAFDTPFTARPAFDTPFTVPVSDEPSRFRGSPLINFRNDPTQGKPLPSPGTVGLPGGTAGPDPNEPPAFSRPDIFEPFRQPRQF